MHRETQRSGAIAWCDLLRIAEPVSSGDSQGRAVFALCCVFNNSASLSGSVAALAAPDFCVSHRMISDKMKDLQTAVDEIIQLISDSSKDHDAWERIVSHCKPVGTIDMKYCKPVELAIEKYLYKISDADKREVYSYTDNGMMASSDETIDWIDFSLQESLFEEVLNQAFYESENK